MALFKRNNKDQAAEDLTENFVEGQAEDVTDGQTERQPKGTPQDVLGANAEDAPGEDPAPDLHHYRYWYG